MVAHTWNPSTLEPEAGALLQVRPDRATQLNSAQIEKKKKLAACETHPQAQTLHPEKEKWST